MKAQDLARHHDVAAPARWQWAVAVVLGAVLSACAAGEGPAPPPPEPAVLEGAPIREGVVTDAEVREAARLIQEGERLLAEGRPAEALDRAVQVEQRLATVPGSSRALWLRARAASALEEWQEAQQAVERYLDVVPATEPTMEEASVLRAEVMRSGAVPGAVEAVFELPRAPTDPPLADRIEELALQWAAEMETPVLRDLVVEAPRHPLVLPAFLSELAMRRFLSGAQEDAEELADEALALGGGPVAEERARGVLLGDVDASAEVAAVLGGLLPTGGSPSLRQLAQEIRDGVEVALAMEEGQFSRPLRFVPENDVSSASTVASSVRALEEEGTLAMIGPLEESLIAAAAQARRSEFPILSPTARLIPEGLTGVYSLTGVDPGAGETLARLALSRGARRVVLLQAAMPEMDQDARWFREAFSAGGGTVIRTLSYAPGAAQFEAQMTEITRLRPDGLVMFVPPGDVELVAPQISFYGVDDIPGLVRLGNESWTSEGVIETVQPRHLNGILSVTSWVEVDAYGPGWTEFVQAYEEHFQRTLRSPTPALGYDAARLLSTAARQGGGTAEGTRDAFERISDFPGATGRLSVVDGRIQREFTPVRIQGGQLVPLTL